MSEREVVEYIEDILEAIETARRFVEEIRGCEQFAGDDRTVFAVIRALKVIGEATKRLPESLRREYAQVPWQSMAGMRDKLIHDYVEVDRRIVWRTVQDALPDLHRQLRSIRQEVGP